MIILKKKLFGVFVGKSKNTSYQKTVLRYLYDRVKNKQLSCKEIVHRIHFILEKILGKKGTRQWMHQPNALLAVKSPQQLIDELDKKGAELVLDLVFDMITGSIS